MSHLPGHELRPSTAQPESTRQEKIAAQDVDSQELSTLMVTDFRLAEGDPGRYTAILVTPEQLAELKGPSDDGMVQYSHWQEGTLEFSSALTVSEARPFALAANSGLRGSGKTEQQAEQRAIRQVTQKLGALAGGII